MIKSCLGLSQDAVVRITKVLRFDKIVNECDFYHWKPYYNEFNIRYYWLPNTYYNIYHNLNLVGVGGLHKLKRDRVFLMRGCYIFPQYRKRHLLINSKSVHHHSIEFRINLAKENGAKTLWVRCNKNSINNYKEHGFELTLDNGKQYLPLCLNLTD